MPNNITLNNDGLTYLQGWLGHDDETWQEAVREARSFQEYAADLESRHATMAEIEELKQKTSGAATVRP